MGFPERVKQGLLFILERTGSKRAKCWSSKGSKRDFVHENIRHGTNSGGVGVSSGPAHMLGRHRDTQTDPTVGNGERKQICHSVLCLHRSRVNMCKNSALPSVCRAFLRNAHTPLHTAPLRGLSAGHSGRSGMG